MLTMHYTFKSYKREQECDSAVNNQKEAILGRGKLSSHLGLLAFIGPLHVRHFVISSVWTGAQTNTAETMAGRHRFVSILGFKAIG